MGSTTTRLAIPYPVSSDPNNVPSDMEALANRVDGIIGAESSGTLASRPAYGNAGFKYFATDADNSDGTLGVWFYDTGTAWVSINPDIAIGGSPSPSLVGATAVNGSTGVAADVGHVHARESFATGATSSSAPGDTNGDGASTSPARADHKHAREAQTSIGITGEIRFGGWASAPTSWLLCDGTAYSRTTYAALYAAIGTAYGAGDGSTTFNVPDHRGRVPVGAGAGAGLTSRTRGATGGEETHVLSTAELAAHNHGVNDPNHNHGNTGTESANHTHNFPGTQVVTLASSSVGLQPGGSNPALGNGSLVSAAESASHVHSTANAATGISTQNAGSGTGHNNMQPFLVVTAIIKT